MFVRGQGSGDAVGAEEDAELGVEAVAGVDEVVVAEAEHGGLLRALEVHEHRAVAGVLGEDVLEPADLGVGERVELAPSPAPAARCRATSSGRVISMAMILGVSSRTSRRPFTTTMASSSSRCP